MTTIRCLSVAALSVLCLSEPVAADLGDVAPPLRIDKWVKGHPVELGEGRGENIFIIAFWSPKQREGTDKDGLRNSLVLLSDIAGAYRGKGIVVAAVAPDESSAIDVYLKEAGGISNISFGADARAGTLRAYLSGFDFKPNPYAFVVDKNGRLVWRGRPRSGLRAALDAVLAGKHDYQALKKADRLWGKLIKFDEMISRKGHEKGAAKLGEEFVTDGAADGLLMHQIAALMLVDSRVLKPDLELAKRAAKACFDAADGKEPSAARVYLLALTRSGDSAGADQLRATFPDLAKVDAKALEESVRQSLFHIAPEEKP